jgi:hypothetical protein
MVLHPVMTGGAISFRDFSRGKDDFKDGLESALVRPTRNGGQAERQLRRVNELANKMAGAENVTPAVDRARLAADRSGSEQAIPVLSDPFYPRYPRPRPSVVLADAKRRGCALPTQPSTNSEITISEVSILWTGHLCAISCRRVRCSSLRLPSKVTARWMRWTKPSVERVHSAQSLACTR